MFNYKSPLSRILEKTGDDAASKPAEAEAPATEETQVQAEEYIEDVEADVAAAEAETVADKAFEDEQPADDGSDFMVLQSAFEDDDLPEEENIFAEATEAEESAEDQVESNSSMAEVLTLMTAREARASISPVAEAPAAEEVAEEAPEETLSDVLTMPVEETADVLEEPDIVAEEVQVEEPVAEAPTEIVEEAAAEEVPAEVVTEAPAEAVDEPAEEVVTEPVVEAAPETAEEEATAAVEAAEEPAEEASAPVAAPAPRRRARIKTTFLGLDHVDHRLNDLISSEPVKKTAVTTSFPVGWLVITSGPGRGTSLALTEGLLQIGRNDDQALQLDFGDNGISRSNHAVIAYDSEERKCFLGHGGKANLVRLNGSPVLSTLPLTNGDMIRISETTMRFVSLCDENFDWRDDA